MYLSDVPMASDEATADIESLEKSDADPPYLYGMEITPSRIVDGQTVTVTADVEDDISGVKSVMGVLKSPSGKSYQSFYCRETPEPGRFSGKVVIPKDAERGEWYLSSVTVKDKAGNSYAYHATKDPVIQSVALLVESSGSDSTPPELTGIKVPSSSIQDGETIKIGIDALDDYSGVKSIWGSFRSPSSTATAGFTGRPTERAGVFEATVRIPKNAEHGEWKIKYVQLTDKAGNRRSYQETDPILLQAVIFVSSSESDADPPLLKSVVLSPKIVNQNGTVIVTVRVEDEMSGPKSVTGWARNPAQTGRIIFTCKQQELDPDLFVGQLIIPENAQVGEWFIDSVHVYDKANNLKLYLASRDKELADATFEVK
ncbi:Ig-like domain repeat protein [Acidobacteriota bacterium]